MSTWGKAQTWPRCASMSNRPVFLLFVRIRIKGKSRFRFSLPLPLYVGLAFADMLDDLGALTALFCPRVSFQTASNGEQLVSSLVRTITGTIFDFLWELVFFTGPLDLVDIDVEDESDTVQIKVMTR